MTIYRCPSCLSSQLKAPVSLSVARISCLPFTITCLDCDFEGDFDDLLEEDEWEMSSGVYPDC